MHKPQIGITLGDIAGIGPEIAVKSLLENHAKEYQAVFYGFSGLIAELAEQLGYTGSIRSIPKESKTIPAEYDLVIKDFGSIISTDIDYGKVSGTWGSYAMQFVEQAVSDAQEKIIDGIVTAPINKEGIHLGGFSAPGHTEFLAELTETKEFAMMLVAEPVRVTLVTIHQSLRSVPDSISEEKILMVTKLTLKALSLLGINKPKIAVCALNPHAGEAGSFGNEDEKIVLPAIKELQNLGYDVSGPHPSDTLFYYVLKGQYDGVIAMYHDQGLIPVKMLGMDRGVNITLGLPIIRTSPDHGTAYAIAGKGIADPGSMIAAIKYACRMANTKHD